MENIAINTVQICISSTECKRTIDRGQRENDAYRKTMRLISGHELVKTLHVVKKRCVWYFGILTVTRCTQLYWYSG